MLQFSTQAGHYLAERLEQIMLSPQTQPLTMAHPELQEGIEKWDSVPQAQKSPADLIDGLLLVARYAYAQMVRNGEHAKAKDLQRISMELVGTIEDAGPRFKLKPGMETWEAPGEFWRVSTALDQTALRAAQQAGRLPPCFEVAATPASA